ncbi:unnamed protein product [Medioppia subpectinata]|uniref:Uncharacterized protein n=1 Tax=Medioppia subpectinata TaxID=1979941 RepID=A0A7R9PX19_9ACAR|nr:unnamed protein product [Medioppia subpectinata]CAG2104563.1 unnamed protein product [Medioppia subpectinata]
MLTETMAKVEDTIQKINSLSPIDKRDEVIAFLFNYGDPRFSYPSITKIGKACYIDLNSLKGDLIEHIAKEYRGNKKVQKAAQVMFESALIPEAECRKAKGPMARSGDKQTRIMNEKRFEAKDYRRFLENILADAARPETTIKMSQIVCFLKLWITKTVPKYPEENGVRKRVSTHINEVMDPLIEYLDTLAKDKTKSCDFYDYEELHTKSRFKSIQLNLIDAINNLTKK